MSEQLLKKLGLGHNDLQPLSISKIQTGKMGASLEILGELKTRVQLRLGGCKTLFRCQPVVVRGLTHDLNLSGPFLRQNRIDQLHSRDALRINGHEVPLLTARGRPAVPRAEVSSSPAYFEKKTIVPANSIMMCSLCLPEIIRGTMPPGAVSVEVSQANCHPWLLAIVDVKEDGLIKAGVMNTLDKPITIQSGQQYSKVTLTCDVNEAHSFQACLPTIRPRSSPTSTPTTLTDATLRALLVNSLSLSSLNGHQTAPPARPGLGAKSIGGRNIASHHQRAQPTRKKPGAPSNGDSTDSCHHQGAPPAPTELGAPSTGKIGYSCHQGAPPTQTALEAPSTSDSCQSPGAPLTLVRTGGALYQSTWQTPRGATRPSRDLGAI
jgi:hypothetical protein